MVYPKAGVSETVSWIEGNDLLKSWSLRDFDEEDDSSSSLVGWKRQQECLRAGSKVWKQDYV